MSDKYLYLPLRLACCLAMLLIAGCVEDTITSTIPGAERALPPDRTLVHRFQVVPDYVEAGRLERDKKVQTAEEIRVGKILTEALAKNLVENLRGYGIDAALARDGAPPEDKTISIYGQFMHIEEQGSSNVVVGFAFGGPLRTRVLLFQGTGNYNQFISQVDGATQSGLKSGMAPAAIESDAKRAAKDAAERIANYYRKRGWLKP